MHTLIQPVSIARHKFKVFSRIIFACSEIDLPSSTSRMTENTITIKSYEPIDDDGLLELIGSNLLNTSPINFKFLILSSLDRFGWKWVAVAVVLPFALIAGLLVTLGYSELFSLSIAIVLTGMILFLVYGVIMPPIRTKGIYNSYTKGVFPRLKDIKKNYMEKEDSHFWIATQKEEGSSKEKIVGCVLVTLYSWDYDHLKIANRRELYGKVADFGRMYVSPEIRRQGLGSRLLNTVLAFSRAHDYDHIAMSLWASNTAAATLYKKVGFKRLGSAYYDKSWFPAMCHSYIMSLKN